MNDSTQDKGPRAIVHLDLDAFYAAVEALENPELEGKALIVGGRPEERGVVATASYPARRFGVRSAMPTSRALALCPEAVILPPRHRVYRKYPHQVMARYARGMDPRPIITEYEPKSVSQERTFSRDLADAEALEQKLWDLSQGVAQQLQKMDRVTGTVAIKLRYGDFTTLTRQVTLNALTHDVETIYQAAQALLARAWQRGRPLRLLGVAARRLSSPDEQPPGKQLSLW